MCCGCCFQTSLKLFIRRGCLRFWKFFYSSLCIQLCFGICWSKITEYSEVDDFSAFDGIDTHASPHESTEHQTNVLLNGSLTMMLPWSRKKELQLMSLTDPRVSEIPQMLLPDSLLTLPSSCSGLLTSRFQLTVMPVPLVTPSELNKL